MLAALLAGTLLARSHVQQTIAAYKPLRRHPDLFDGQSGWRQWIDPNLLAALDAQNGTALQALMRPEVDGVHSFQLFSEEFCKKFLEELDGFYASGLPIDRPNSMNNYVRPISHLATHAFAIA